MNATQTWELHKWSQKHKITDLLSSLSEDSMADIFAFALNVVPTSTDTNANDRDSLHTCTLRSQWNNWEQSNTRLKFIKSHKTKSWVTGLCLSNKNKRCTS